MQKNKRRIKLKPIFQRERDREKNCMFLALKSIPDDVFISTIYNIC